jgi:hypothetical protein
MSVVRHIGDVVRVDHGDVLERDARDVSDAWDTSAPGSPVPEDLPLVHRCTSFTDSVSTALRHDGCTACTDAVGSYALNEGPEGSASRGENIHASESPSAPLDDTNNNVPLLLQVRQ